MFLYESHMGGLFTSEEDIDYDYLYCKICGDSDSFLGEFETEEELRKLLELNECAEYYHEDYLEEVIESSKK